MDSVRKFHQVALFHRALGCGRRLLILALLLVCPRTVKELQSILKIRSSCVSRHLAVLRRAGLVQGTRKGMNVEYSVLRVHEVKAILRHAHLVAIR